MEERDLVKIAERNPRLAWGLAQCGHFIQIYSGEAILDVDALNRPVPVVFQQVPNFSYVGDITYEQQMMSFAPGNMARYEALHYAALHPDVDMKLAVAQGMGPMNHLVGSDFMPIQHYFRNTSSDIPSGPCTWSDGWLLFSYQALQIELLLRRALAAGEAPLRITYGLKTKVLPCDPRVYSFEEAYEGLAGLGIPVKRRPAALPQGG